MAQISQLLAVSYPAVLAEKKKPANQWEESSFLREAERQGAIVRKSLGATIEAPLDYQRNPGTVIQSAELQPLNMSKTEVITTASYAIAEVTAPITWSKKDEVTNTTQTQKVALVTSLAANAIKSHDDILEQSFFLGTTNLFLGFQTVVPFVPTSGVLGGIDPSVALYWRNQTATYVDDTDIEAGMTSVWNKCTKGSGSSLMPTLIVSDAPTQALFEGTQQPNQRYVDEQELKAGFKVLAFKTSRYVFSQYAGNNGAQYFINPKSWKLVVSKEYFRDFDETFPLPNANGFGRRIYTACNVVVDNRSRLGINGTASSV